MQKLIDLAKGYPRVFIRLKTPHEKAEFLRQATEEGFMIGNKLPSQCECNDVMIIHENYTLNYCVGTATNWLLHSKQAKVVDFSDIINT